MSKWDCNQQPAPHPAREIQRREAEAAPSQKTNVWTNTWVTDHMWSDDVSGVCVWPPSLARWDVGRPGPSLRGGSLQKKLRLSDGKKGRACAHYSLMWHDLVWQIVMMAELSATHQNTRGAFQIRWWWKPSWLRVLLKAKAKGSKYCS